MKPRDARVLPTLTEVLEPPRLAAAARSDTAALSVASPSDDELRSIVAQAIATGIEELRAQLQPRVEALVREALVQRQQPAHGGD
jgi:hypothetical protein